MRFRIRDAFVASLLLILSMAGRVMGAELWDDHEDLPEWFRRGTSRFLQLDFSGSDISARNYAALGCNLYRMNTLNLEGNAEQDHVIGAIMEDLGRSGVHAMHYTSPTDCFFDDRLSKVVPGISRFYINLFTHYPWLENAVAVDSKGEKVMAYNNPQDRGGNAVRRVGCRNNPVWREFREKWSLYMIAGPTALIKDIRFSALPSRAPIHENVAALFIDNAGVRPCCCDFCWNDWRAFWKERFPDRPLPAKDHNYWASRAERPEEFAAHWEFETGLVTAFNRRITDLCHEHGRPTQINAGPGQNFATIAQLQAGAADSLLWELLYRHPPWGRLAPWYKRGLAAGRGRPVFAVTYTVPPTDLEEFSMPVLTPDFTRMALAEGFATQGIYTLFTETGGNFFTAVSGYHHFNALNQDLYSFAQPGGRIAIVLALRSGLLLGRLDSCMDPLVSRLMRAGLPVEIITESDINGELRDHFDIVIAPDLTCATDALVEALARFHARGGGLMIAEDFATRDWNCRPWTSAAAADLLAGAKAGAPSLRLLNRYGANLGDAELLNLVAQAGAGKPPQRLVWEQGGDEDCIINALKHPRLGLESFHIVNFNYSMNPACLLRSTSESVAWDFWSAPGKAPGMKIYIYGREVGGGCDLDIAVNGQRVVLLKAGTLGHQDLHEGFPVELPRWIGVDLAGVELKALNRVVLTPAAQGQGGFVIYIDPQGTQRSACRTAEAAAPWSEDLAPGIPGVQRGSYTMACAAQEPAACPLKTQPAPLRGARLTLAGYGRDWDAVVLSPDAPAARPAIAHSSAGLTLTLPEVSIYSVVLLGRDPKQLAALADRNGEPRSMPSARVVNRGQRARTQGVEQAIVGFTASSSHAEYPVTSLGSAPWVDGTPDAYPDWVEGRLEGPVTANRITVTFEGVRVSRDFEIQVEKDQAWVRVGEAQDNTQPTYSCEFPPMVTSRVRVLIKKGLAFDPRYSSLSGIQVFHREN